jgi:hypothetical protein
MVGSHIATAPYHTIIPKGVAGLSVDGAVAVDN